MKKLFFVLMVMGFASTVWGQNKTGFSIGGGVFIGSDFGGGFENEITMGPTITVSLPMNYFGGGGFVFFDATYIETSFGLFVGGGEWEMNIGAPINQTEKIGDFSFTSINYGLSLKYPFPISSKVKAFPLLGLDYQMVIAAELENEKADVPDDWNQFWFKFGGGFDYELNTSWYFRLAALYGIRLASVAEKDYADASKLTFQSEFYRTYGIIPNITSDTLPGYGLTVKIAVGYKY
jgi:hypothetical protein